MLARVLHIKLIWVLIAWIALTFTVPHPAQARISNIDIRNNNETLYVNFNYTGPVGTLHIYIDVDQNQRNGYVLNNLPGLTGPIGAEYMVEYNTLHRLLATTYNFPLDSQLQNLGGVNLEISSEIEGEVTASWPINLSRLGFTCPNPVFDVIYLAFDTVDLQFNLNDIVGPIRYDLTCSDGTPVPTLPVLPTISRSESLDFRIGVPGYFYPDLGAADGYWNQMGNTAPTVGLAIANPFNGPGEALDENYVQAIRTLQDRGMMILGYVHTTYGDRSLVEVTTDIGHFYEWYQVDGIFIDEVTNTCDNSLLTYYRTLYQYVKSQDLESLVVINPGINTQPCYANLADVIVNYESGYAEYQFWQPSGWETNYPPQLFWHIVYDVPQPDLSNTLALAISRNAGWFYFTDDTLGTDNNPYDTLPSIAYWTDFVRGVINLNQ